jgi:glutaminyl-peptide cyclotransferase
MAENQWMLIRNFGMPRCKTTRSVIPFLRAALLALFSLTAHAAPILSFHVVRELPHDTARFTQGLVVHDELLLESTGGYGESAVFVQHVADGRLLRSKRLPGQRFGEGITVFGGRVIQLTWKAGIAYVFDLQLRTLGRFRYRGEGWGLTHDGRRLIMSDGSSRLTFRDPYSFVVTGQLEVTDDGQPLHRINAMTFAYGHVYANVWYRDDVAVINPDSGNVVAWIDFSPLRARITAPDWEAPEHVLNGIAFRSDTDTFFVTGKRWPVLFEVRIEPLPEPDSSPVHAPATIQSPRWRQP